MLLTIFYVMKIQMKTLMKMNFWILNRKIRFLMKIRLRMMICYTNQRSNPIRYSVPFLMEQNIPDCLKEKVLFSENY